MGEKRKRYQVPLAYLSLPMFQQLIKDSNGDDDFDFKIDGPILVSCDGRSFDHFLQVAEKTLHTQNTLDPVLLSC